MRCCLEPLSGPCVANAAACAEAHVLFRVPRQVLTHLLPNSVQADAGGWSRLLSAYFAARPETHASVSALVLSVVIGGVLISTASQCQVQNLGLV